MLSKITPALVLPSSVSTVQLEAAIHMNCQFLFLLENKWQRNPIWPHWASLAQGSSWPIFFLLPDSPVHFPEGHFKDCCLQVRRRPHQTSVFWVPLWLQLIVAVIPWPRTADSSASVPAADTGRHDCPGDQPGFSTLSLRCLTVPQGQSLTGLLLLFLKRTHTGPSVCRWNRENLSLSCCNLRSFWLLLHLYLNRFSIRQWNILKVQLLKIQFRVFILAAWWCRCHWQEGCYFWFHAIMWFISCKSCMLFTG